MKRAVFMTAFSDEIIKMFENPTFLFVYIAEFV